MAICQVYVRKYVIMPCQPIRGFYGLEVEFDHFPYFTRHCISYGPVLVVPNVVANFVAPMVLIIKGHGGMPHQAEA